MRKLVLFDIDGTLLLTGGAGGRAMGRAFEEAFAVRAAFSGIPMAGRTDRAILADALDRLGLVLPPAGLEQFVRRYCRLLEEEIRAPADGKRLMPGVRELLDDLAVRPDVFVALLTGNFAEAARIKLDHFGLWQYFPCGAFGDDAPERRDLVQIAVERARRHGLPAIEAASVLVVGDTPLDVACALDSGATAVAVATGGFDVQALTASGAHVVLSDLSDREAFAGLLA